ncbi:homeobox protein XHOX-7.1-like [Daphnia carinata]|uniref:homeobox protein XHOX-7.1-like n=1 Tax=Daphnia carinata TaxID=120202 RepID=UPI00257CDABC|nr:homeobox protein XHOX-7.1-like [Daphnia carinata]
MESAVITKNQEVNQGDVTTEEHPIAKDIDISQMPQDELFGPVAEKPMEILTVRSKPKVDFSIEAILSSRTSPASAIVVTSSEIFSSQSKTNSINDHGDPHFSWVYCTRYRPPKLPRAKREINLRNRYRNPRIPFSTIEVSTLERKFLQTPYLGSNEVNELAAALNMSPKRVKIWFQNRRARERREREVQ